MRFFLTFLIALTGCFVAWLCLIRGEVGNATLTSQWIYDTYSKKEKIAQAIPGKKIVIAAGSNALFGVNSQMLGEAFGLPVVNDAVNAGIELPCVLYMAKRVIGEGDIVIMPLEHSMYAYDGKPGVQMIDFLFSREPGCFRTLHPAEQFYVLWHVTIGRIIDGYLNKGGEPVKEGVYGAHHIDEYGDQTHTEVKYRSEAMYQYLLQSYNITPPFPYGKHFSQSAPGWSYLKDFIQWCAERHAKVIFMPATQMVHHSFYDVPVERWFFTNIAEEVRSRGWNYVGKPYDYIYPESLYFNTDSHLIDRGRTLRTRQMIKDLQESGLMGL